MSTGLQDRVHQPVLWIPEAAQGPSRNADLNKRVSFLFSGQKNEISSSTRTGGAYMLGTKAEADEAGGDAPQ